MSLTCNVTDMRCHYLPSGSARKPSLHLAAAYPVSRSRRAKRPGHARYDVRAVPFPGSIEGRVVEDVAGHETVGDRSQTWGGYDRARVRQLVPNRGPRRVNLVHIAARATGYR